MDTETAPKTKILKNGAVYDLERKRIVAVKPELAEVDTRITAENGREYQSRAVAKKRLVMMQAANAEVPAELVAQYGDYAHVAERAQNLQRIASSPEAGKAAVMAHQALTADTGMAEPKGAEQAGADVLDAAASLFREIAQWAATLPQVVDVATVEPEPAEGEVASEG